MTNYKILQETFKGLCDKYGFIITFKENDSSYIKLIFENNNIKIEIIFEYRDSCLFIFLHMPDNKKIDINKLIDTHEDFILPTYMYLEMMKNKNYVELYYKTGYEKLIKYASHLF